MFDSQVWCSRDWDRREANHGGYSGEEHNRGSSLARFAVVVIDQRSKACGF